MPISTCPKPLVFVASQTIRNRSPTFVDQILIPQTVGLCCNTNTQKKGSHLLLPISSYLKPLVNTIYYNCLTLKSTSHPKYLCVKKSTIVLILGMFSNTRDIGAHVQYLSGGVISPFLKTSDFSWLCFTTPLSLPHSVHPHISNLTWIIPVTVGLCCDTCWLFSTAITSNLWVDLLELRQSLWTFLQQQPPSSLHFSKNCSLTVNVCEKLRIFFLRICFFDAQNRFYNILQSNVYLIFRFAPNHSAII